MTKVPAIIKRLYSNYVWDIPTKENILYLTFDDGPRPEATPFVLEQLRIYNAKATFFCVGNNVEQHPEIYRQIIGEGHATGNHTFHHLNGWKVSDRKYFDDIIEARKYIDSILFRPPYGRITRFQSRHLRNSVLGFKIIMWDVLSKDYDQKLNAEDCSFNVLRFARPGSIVVFHDSEKAFPRMKEALRTTLKYFSEKGYRFEAIRLV